MDCGPACLVMIARHYGKRYPIEYLREKAFITREGVSLLGISEAAHKIGLETQSVKLTEEQLEKNNEIFPCILHWNQNHFVVLFKITTSYFSNKKYFYIADPAHGIIKLSKEKFKQSWLSEENTGVAMFLNPTEEFEKRIPPKQEKVSIKYLLSYLAPYRKQLSLMFLLLLFGSGLTLIFPFLTEALIDKGVNAKDLNFIFIILLTQPVVHYEMKKTRVVY
ncbi:hypothetical protein D9O39_05545 [Riemerella anatipestifer]|nr:hypothetical protein [Riemerella anatipestifer]UZF09140.1 hypothetical protein D9O39_05545 [Riemerella anatipestifer]